MQNYESQGWIHLHNVFDPVALKEKSQQILQHKNKDYFLYEQTGDVRSVFSPFWLDDTLSEYIENPKVLDTVKSILGNNIYMHQNHFNYKKAKVGGEYAWHSDYTFWCADDGMLKPDAISCLFLVDDMQIDNGPLEVLSGSHVEYITKQPSETYQIKHDNKETNGMITQDMVSKTQYKRHTVLGKAGDVFCMHSNLWHTSSANTSDKDRCIFFVCYNSLDNKVTKPTRPEFIVNRDFVPI